jgi:hypothetical protein
MSTADGYHGSRSAAVVAGGHVVRGQPQADRGEPGDLRLRAAILTLVAERPLDGLDRGAGPVAGPLAVCGASPDGGLVNGTRRGYPGIN